MFRSNKNQQLRSSGYLKDPSRKYDVGGAMLGIVGIVVALLAITGSVSIDQLFDPNSLVFIVVGTFSVTIFQYDLKSLVLSLQHISASVFSMRILQMRKLAKELDTAVETGKKITDFQSAGKPTGDLVSDVSHFYSVGMSFDEIDEILASSLVTDVLLKKRSAEIFFRASQLAPALGLLGTIVGLVGVLRSLGDPGQIGASMALALMTTGYGAALGNLILGPLAGRLESQSDVLLQVQREIVRKLHILYLRSETDPTSLRKIIA